MNFSGVGLFLWEGNSDQEKTPQYYNGIKYPENGLPAIESAVIALCIRPQLSTHRRKSKVSLTQSKLGGRTLCPQSCANATEGSRSHATNYEMPPARWNCYTFRPESINQYHHCFLNWKITLRGQHHALRHNNVPYSVYRWASLWTSFYYCN